MTAKLFMEKCREITDPSLLPYCYKSAEVLQLSAKEDRKLLLSLARHGQGTLRKAALKRLKPEDETEIDLSEGAEDEMYFILQEQVKRVIHSHWLEEAIYHGSPMHALFAFCRLTGASFPAPANDVLSHRTYECGCFDQHSDFDRILHFRAFSPMIAGYVDPKTARMRLAGPAAVEEYSVSDSLALTADRTISAWLFDKGEELKNRAKITVRFSGVDSRISVCVMGIDQTLCETTLQEFETLLRSCGYLKKENL